MRAQVLRGLQVTLRVAIGVVIVVELLLLLGILLQGLDANPEASFTDWTYRNFDRVMGPFEGMFDDGSLGDGDGVLDFSAMFAMGVWAIAFIPLGMALGGVDRRLAEVAVVRQRAADTARQDLLFGGGEAASPTPKPTVVERVRTVFTRRGDRSPATPDDAPPGTDA